MFDDLKAARPARSKEKTRLWVTVAACLVLGTAIYGGKMGCSAQPDRKVPVAVEEAAKEKEKEKAAPAVELDRTPLLPLAESGGPLDDFDGKALEYVTTAAEKDSLSRRPWKTATPAEILAADPKEAIGRMIETKGIVRNLDREEREFPGMPPGTGRLWAFSLEGPDGAQIAVVRRGSSHNSVDEQRPEAWMPLPGSGSGRKLKDGDLVMVRGIYLQRRTGTIARISLPGPTPVLVGREFRFTEDPNPPLENPSQASFSKIQDRFLKDMGSVESDAAKQIVQWAQKLGHAEIVRRIDSGEIPVEPWGRDEFAIWRREMAAEQDSRAPDRRTFAPAQRGKAFWMTGILQDFLQEDWDRLPPNAFGVDKRWKVYVLSDHHGYLPLVFDSPFPVTEFPGVAGLPKERVRMYGIYVQTHTFEVGHTPESSRRGPVESPFFVLLDLRPLAFPGRTPILKNPFFWTWVSLGVFGVVFFLVLSRVEKKEKAAIDAQSLRIRRRQRELGQSPGAPKPKRKGSDPAPPPEEPPPGGGDVPGSA
jgi:hypothetical protein